MTRNEAEKWMTLAAQFALTSTLLVTSAATQTAIREITGSLIFIMACGLLTVIVPLSLFHLFKTIIPLFRKRAPERFRPAITFGAGNAFFIPLACGFGMDGFLWIFFWVAVIRLIDPFSARLQLELTEAICNQAPGA